MERTTLLLFVILSTFSVLQMDCTDEPIKPCTDCPQPTDTTSHDFIWQIDTLGDGNGTSLYDVAIINDTLAYAVGEIFIRDSTGQFENDAYNFAQWDGKKWKLLRVPTEAFGGLIGFFSIRTIFVFNTNDIWTFSIAGSYSHWNGMIWTTKFLSERSGGGLKYWGSGPSNLYLTGTDGSLSHYDGNLWQKLSSGTKLPINDIWGAKNEGTGEWEIIAVASNNFSNQGKKLLRINGTSVSALPDSGLPWSLSGIWSVPGKSYYVTGDGLYNLPTIGPIWKRDTISNYYKTSIRGNHENDVFVTGSFMLLMHYNGKSWKKYFEGINGVLGQVEIKKNFVVAVGTANNRGVIIRGYRH